VPSLTVPTPIVQASFLEAMAEFRAEGRGGPTDESMIGHEHKQFGRTWTGPEGFADYVRGLQADAREDTPRPAGYVPCTTWWWTDDDDAYLGRIALRHRLTPFLLEVGGHIGYDVRPAARRRGHATAMLRAVLPHARAIGIHRALVTCDDDNAGSRKVIEAAGGEFEDQRGVKLRYWVPTS
jgi:predicted acetyltransferase